MTFVSLSLLFTLVFTLVFTVLVSLSPAHATQYCVDAVYGKDTNNGLLVPSTPRASASCWASSTGAYAYVNSASIKPGDEILYCRGNKEYQNGMLIGPTAPTGTLGTRAAPVVFGAYDCRDTQNGTVIWPLPMVSRANILPQSTHSSATQWQKVPWTFANGTVGYVLKYDLTGLVSQTGVEFVPSFANRNSNGATVLAGLWINGVQYVEARYPNMINPNITHGNDTREFMLLDPSRVKTGPIGWSYYVLSNSTDLYLSVGSWCQMRHQLYGTNDAQWKARGSQSNYYSAARTVFRANDFVIQESVLNKYEASTVDCVDGGAFVTTMVNCTAPCVPLNYGWDDQWLRTLPVPVQLANTSNWLPTHLHNVGGDTSFYLNWYNSNNSNNPSNYGGWSMAQIFVNHTDFLDAPQEYLIIGDSIYVIPASSYHEQLLLTNYDPSVVPLTQTAFAHALVDLGLNAAPTVVLFNAGMAKNAVFGMVGQYSGPLNQYYEVREFELRYSYTGWYTWHCAEFNIHHVIFRDMVQTALFVSGGGVVQGSTDPGQQMSLMAYNNWFERCGAGIYAVSTSMQIVNNTFIDTAMVWGVNAGGYVVTVDAYDWGTFWGNHMIRAGYVGIAAQASIDVAFNTFNHTSAIHLDGGPITTNGVIEWNLVGSADTNMLSGIVGGGAVGLSRGIYGLSADTTLVNNLLFNVSGQCIFGGNATAPITMEGNICVNAGWQLNPFPETAELAAQVGQIYNNNSIYFMNPILDSDVEYWQLPYQQPFLGLSQGGRWLIQNTPTTYPLFNGTYLCVGVVEPLVGSTTGTQFVSAIISPTADVLTEYVSVFNVSTSTTTSTGMQFALSPIALPWGPTYLTSVESYIKNAELWAESSASNTIFEFGQAHCTSALEHAVRQWVKSRNQNRTAREPGVKKNMTSLISSDYVFPRFWPWPASPRPMNVSNLNNTSPVNPVWVYRGCFQDQQTRAIPTQLPGLFNTPLQCETAAVQFGFDTVGLQSGTQCWGGVSPDYARWGPAVCTGVFGAAWQNQVYQLTDATGPVVPPVVVPPTTPAGSWVHVGCFVDKDTRAVPNQLSANIGAGAAVACQTLAAASGFNVIGLQSGAQCWGGLNSNYAQYGPADCAGTFGGAWQNQVYVYTLPNVPVSVEISTQ